MPAQATKTLLGGRYTLLAPLGKGALGTVWRADDTRLHRHVAVKEVRLPPDLPGQQRASVRARALREARAAARFSHPSAVKVYDVVEGEDSFSIVMELVDGSQLADFVGRRGPLEPALAAGIGLELLDALEAAHERGVVHRDVNPHNVMLSRDGRAKLTDFGAAALKGDPRLTASGALLGSPCFMAPEQAQGEEGDPATDMWGLGATLYFAIEGAPPFDRGAPFATLTAVVYDDPPPPRRAGPLSPLLVRLLDKQPDRRPSGAALRRALEEAAGTRELPAAASAAEPSARARPAPLALDQLWEPQEQPAPRVTHPAEPSRTRRDGPRIAIAVALLCLLAGIGASLLLADPGGDNPDARAERGRDRASAAAGSGGDREKGAESQADPGGGVEADPGEEVVSADPPATVAVPEGWSFYEEPSTGFGIAYPAGWEIVPEPSGQTSLDFRDPDTGMYLRVDWGDSPGPSPQQAWLDYEPAFAKAHDAYERVALRETTFKGFEASLWEFTYREGGTDLHAVDLGFVTGEYGFALNFQTHADDWAASASLFDVFKATFVPPGGAAAGS
ncbi:MAG TPA: serine/threonine-protein kinase [Actinomycetota bacterium]|nr:serine/threonine-protein kinase [Actinomycetota bacterium]